MIKPDGQHAIAFPFCGCDKMSIEIFEHVENETKLIAKQPNVKSARDILAEHFNFCPGRETETRCETYFDTADFALERSGRSFRARPRYDETSYCYKYILEQCGPFTVRQETIVKIKGFVIDLKNPLHLRLPLFRDLCEFLEAAADDGGGSWVDEFRPRAILSTRRVSYIFNNGETRDQQAAYLLLDEVRGCRIIENRGCQPVSFTEVEIEAFHPRPSTFDLIARCTELLIARGYSVCRENKYQKLLRNRNAGCHDTC
jgi:hypothetical protein